MDSILCAKLLTRVVFFKSSGARPVSVCLLSAESIFGLVLFENGNGTPQRSDKERLYARVTGDLHGGD